MEIEMIIPFTLMKKKTIKNIQIEIEFYSLFVTFHTNSLSVEFKCTIRIVNFH